jgi:hypothetical protein
MDAFSQVILPSHDSRGSVRSLPLSTISDSSVQPPGFPEIQESHPAHLPLTVYYNCESFKNLERIKKEYGCSSRAMLSDVALDDVTEVVDSLPLSNTCLGWKYCTFFIAFGRFRLHN